MYYVYILHCSDGSFYTGHTRDIASRMAMHNKGEGPAYTAARRPVTLSYAESRATEQAAVRREEQIKRWSRAKKKALLEGDINKLKLLSRCRTTI